MPSVTSRILEWAEALPEAAPIRPNSLLHLGSPTAIRQALSRLVRRGLLMRVCQGVYVRTIETPYGRRAPYENQLIQALAKSWGEVIAPNGGAAANILGISEQNVISSVYWTSGPSRTLRHGKRSIVLRHVPPWQLSAADRPAGLLLRALVWLGPTFPQEIQQALEKVIPGLAANDREEFAALQGVMPGWLAHPVSKCLAYR